MDFPNGARVVIAHEGYDDGDPDNYVFLTPWVERVGDSYRVTNIDSEGPPLTLPIVEADYESDELTPVLAFVSEAGMRVMCFQPTDAAIARIERFNKETT